VQAQGIGVQSLNIFFTRRMVSIVVAGWHLQTILSGLSLTHWDHWGDEQGGLHVQALGLWVTVEKN
jgi:hypothetical protein